MTDEKLKSIFQKYREHLDTVYPKVAPRQISDAETHGPVGNLSRIDTTAHFKFMCDEAQLFVDQGRVEKAMRWLGFLQGSFWMDDVFTLDQLKKHSMP